MIVFQINVHGTFIPSEGNAPITTHMYRPPLGFSFKSMKTKTRKVHVKWSFRSIQGSKSPFYSGNKAGGEPLRFPPVK